MTRTALVGRYRWRMLGAALLLCGSMAAQALEAGCRQPAAVCASASSRAMPLIRGGEPASIVADAADFAGVLRAARDLQSDITAVAGEPATFTTGRAPRRGPVIIVGTLGRSARVDRIVRERKVDVSGVAGQWEAYLLQVVENPEPGVGRALLIAGADKRGTIFGIYELSRRMGVSPWTWWADVPVPRRPDLYAAPGRFTDAPVVRYRGIFLNDENPALGGWMKEKFGGPNHQFYEHVFNLILRLKGNALWPAMWGRAFGDDDPENQRLADEYGVVIGTSHHEPLMRADVEWDRYGKGPWDYTQNAETLRDFWRAGIERMGKRESLVTIGMRGDGDLPMTQGTAIGLLERIVADQREIITQVTGKPAEQTPQVWALYKEVQDYYDAGMRVPDDVTLLFSDDNWGNLRRLPEPGARRAGGYGIYYHFDYVGGPRNYKWINTVQIERVWEQMRLAHAHGANQLWIANVGDLKPMEFPISFFLDLAWNPPAMTVERLQAYPAEWAAQQFGRRYAREIGNLLTRYTQYNARRKPELLAPETWSLASRLRIHKVLEAGEPPVNRTIADHRSEAQHVLVQWRKLTAEVEWLGPALGRRFRDAWYQLVQYPVLASANLNELYVAVARNRLYAAQGRPAANALADAARELFARDAELARVYEQDVAGGKWPHMMSQTHIGYTSWQEPPANAMPAVRQLQVPEQAALGLVVEGDQRAWPAAGGNASLPTLRQAGMDSARISLFNQGRAPLRYTASTTAQWLRLRGEEGELGAGQSPLPAVYWDPVPEGERVLEVVVHWDAVPVGTSRGQVIVRGSDGSELRVEVPVEKPAAPAITSGFVEIGGYLAVEAEHYARAVTTPGLAWQTIPNLGRTLSAVTSVPVDAPAQMPGGAGMRLEYPLWLQHSGEIEVRVVVSPTLDFSHQGGVRYAVSIGDGEPQVVTVKADPTPGSADFRAWERAVADSVYIGRTTLQAGAGAQTLKLWRVDPGVVIQRIEVVRGTLPLDYLGPPESPR